MTTIACLAAIPIASVGGCRTYTSGLVVSRFSYPPTDDTSDEPWIRTLTDVAANARTKSYPYTHVGVDRETHDEVKKLARDSWSVVLPQGQS